MSDHQPKDMVPSAPTFSDEQMERCRKTGDYIPVLFEWYKFVGSWAIFVTTIQRHSPAFRPMPQRHYHVLIGLLNRCARLMLSNVALSHEGKFGETTAIVDRCIFESALKVVWLCEEPSDNKFTRFLADGLKTELEFKQEIEANIGARGGKALPIEQRMLGSIRNHIAAAGLTHHEIVASEKMLDVASMMTSLGFTRIHYVVAQKIGSHHVHGSWPSLLFHYLEEQSEEGTFTFGPRGHNCETNKNQYMFVCNVVLQALTSYVRYAFTERQDAETFVSLFDTTEQEIMKVYLEAVGGDLGN
jgi:Family of unknown function (DUF5677)